MAGVESDERNLSQKKRSRQKLVARILTAWVFIISVYFLWEAENYIGFYAFLAEEQFDYLGQYWPVFTYSLLLVLFGWPIAWLLRDTRTAASDGASATSEIDEVLRINQNLRRTLFAVAGGLSGAALVALCWTFTLPRLGEPAAVVAIGSRPSFSPPLGSISLRGSILYDRTSVFAQNLIFRTRGVRFAPIIGPRDRAATIRYFIELQPSDIQNGDVVIEPVSRTGLLRRNALPGSIVQLYKYAGFNVSNSYYVLYTDPLTIKWPYFVTAFQLAVAALICFITALFQHRYTKRQITEYENERAFSQEIEKNNDLHDSI